ALVLLPLAAVCWLGCSGDVRRPVLRVAIMLGGVAVLLVPWAVRSSVALSAVLLSTNGGYNLRVGHAPYATGRYVAPQDLWDEPAADFQALERVFNTKGVQRAYAYAIHHPLRESRFAAKKVGYLWSPDTDALTWLQS